MKIPIPNAKIFTSIAVIFCDLKVFFKLVGQGFQVPVVRCLSSEGLHYNNSVISELQLYFDNRIMLEAEGTSNQMSI